MIPKVLIDFHILALPAWHGCPGWMGSLLAHAANLWKFIKCYANPWKPEKFMNFAWLPKMFRKNSSKIKMFISHEKWYRTIRNIEKHRNFSISIIFRWFPNLHIFQYSGACLARLPPLDGHPACASRKSMKIHHNLWKSMRIIEIDEFGVRGFVLLHGGIGMRF